MEFTVDAASLQRVLKILSVVARNNSEDTDGQILIESVDDKLLFFVNNNKLQLSSLIDSIDMKEYGAIAVSYSKLKSFVMSFTPWTGERGVKEFIFKSDGMIVKLKTVNMLDNERKSRSSLKLKQFDSYRINKPTPFNTANFTLPSQVVKTAINKVIYAIRADISHIALSGMLVKFDADKLYFAGTDGTKLSEYTFKNTCDLKDDSIILNYEYIMALRRLITDDNQLFFEILDGKVNTMLNNTCLYGRGIISAQYPEYREVFKNYTDSIVLDKLAVVSGLSSIIDVLNADDNNRLSINISEGKLKFYCDEAYFEYPDLVDYDGEFEVDMNGRFILQTIETIDDESILMQFSDGNSGLIFDSNHYKDQKALVQNLIKV